MLALKCVVRFYWPLRLSNPQMINNNNKKKKPYLKVTQYGYSHVLNIISQLTCTRLFETQKKKHATQTFSLD